jgi:hypothetical protein
MTALYPASAKVVRVPTRLTTDPFQALLTANGASNPTCQPRTAVGPVFVTVTVAVNPLPQSLCTRKATAAGPGSGFGVGVGVGAGAGMAGSAYRNSYPVGWAVAVPPVPVNPMATLSPGLRVRL